MYIDQTLLIHNGIKTQVVNNNLKNDDKREWANSNGESIAFPS